MLRPDRTEKPTAIDPLDYLAIDALLDDEEKAIRDTVREFVRANVLDDVGDWFEKGTFPRELITELGKLGLLGMHLDGYGLARRELGRLRADVHGARGWRRRRAQRRVGAGLAGDVPDLEVGIRGAEGALAAARCTRVRSSAASASPSPMPDRIPGSMRTHARRDGSDWILNGAKMWITNGTIADIAIVWARTDDGAIRGFIVEKGMPGFSAPEIHKKLSLRASVTSELVLQDVRVPDENALPGATSLRGPLSCLNEARFGIVFGAVGSARACFECALDYARERIVFGKPIAGYQLTQQKLAEMALEINRGSARRAPPRAHEGRRHAPPRAREPRKDGQRARRHRGRALVRGRSSARTA